MGSVFATHTKTRHFRNFAVLVGMCAVVAGGLLAARSVRAPLMAALRDAVESPSVPAVAPTETIFPQPRKIDWDGIVFGVLVGGRGLAVRREDTGEMFQAYAADGQTMSVTSGPVRIKGRWTGISCAYQHIVFSDTCTPTVDIDALEILPVTLE